MIAATMTRRNTVHVLIAMLVIIGTLITTINIAHAAPQTWPIDPRTGTITEQAIDNGILTGTMTILDTKETSHTIKFTLPMNQTFAFSTVDIYTETESLIEFFNGTMYSAVIIPELHGVIVAVKGQHLDATYESFVAKHTNCTVLAVIDDVNDPLSPYIYTKLACHMTQLDIDNLPEDENVLSVMPLYTAALPVVMN